jgi:hypothetical protein
MGTHLTFGGRAPALLFASSFCLLSCGGRSRSLTPESDGTAPPPAAAADWTTLTHTPPPEPAPPFTWTGGPAAFHDVWSDSSERVWVISTQENYEAPMTSAVRRWEAGEFQSEATEYLYESASISGLTGSDLWLAGDTGVQHSDGVSWTTLASGQGALIAEASPNDVWSCCRPGATPDAYSAAHWNGSQWTPVALPVLSDFAPAAIFARPGNDVWIAGGGGYLLQGSASGWLPLRDSDVARWDSVWGDAEKKNVWTVGGSVIARWDSNGVEHRVATAGVLPDGVGLSDVWGSGPDTIWAVGSGGTILSLRGTTLALEASGTTVQLGAVWGVASGTIWVAGAEETLLERSF